MQLSFDIARWIHIASGFLSLCVFWIPIITKKGGSRHNRAGWVYVIGMACVSITAFYMAIYRLTWDAGPDSDAVPYSWFLLFIAVLSSATAWYGLRVLRHKRRRGIHWKPIDLLFPFALFSSGVGISIYGWTISFSLLQYFPLLGMFLGGTQLLYWLRAPKKKSHWAVEHIVGTLSCCIATITAFLVFGAPRLLGVESANLFLWVFPTLVLLPLIIWFTNAYKRKMDGPRIA